LSRFCRFNKIDAEPNLPYVSVQMINNIHSIGGPSKSPHMNLDLIWDLSIP
jgi:hypothetical protein